MKKVLSLILSVLMLVGSFSLMASAVEKPEGVGDVLWNEDMLAGKDLKSLFNISTNSGTAGTVAYENGKLKFTGTGGLDCFALTGVSLGLNTTVKDYTIVADVTYTGTVTTNARFQLGVRPTSFVGSKNQDWYSGLMYNAVAEGGVVTGIRFQASNNIATSGSNSAITPEGSFFDDNNVPKPVSYKIVIEDTKPSIYARIDGGDWLEVGSFGGSSGKPDEENILFFVVRTGNTVVVDNLVVYSGAESSGDDGGDDVGGGEEEVLKTDPVYYPNGTVILNEDILKPNASAFEVAYQNGQKKGSATTYWNEDTGRLVVKGDTAANAIFRYKPFPESLDYFTITADLYLVANNYGKNVLFQIGTRNPHMEWGHGNMIQLYVNYDEAENGKDKAQVVDKGYDAAITSSVVELGSDIDVGAKISIKIVVNEKIAEYYVNDTWIYSVKVDKFSNSYGDLFFATRPNVE